MPSAKSEYQDMINLSYAKYPDDQDRLYKVFRDNTLNNYGARKLIEQMDLDLKKFKEDRDKYEYVDYFVNFLKKQNPPPLKYLFIDEAQDLSAQQWQVVDMIQQRSGAIETYIAGDDDQAIFRWAGADVDSFITQTGKLLPLIQSRRIPKKVHDVAMKIIGRVSNRIPKNWVPRTVEGSLTIHNAFEDIDMSSGEWMVLARTRYMLETLEETLRTKGFYYENRFQKSYEKDIQEAAIDWEHLRKGQLLHYKEIEKISKYMGPTHWEKIKLKGMTKDSFHGIDKLTKDFGLKINTEWFNAFDDCTIERKEYIRAMRRNGEALNKDPRIHLSTIHSVKGGERQNVVLLTDLSHNTYKSYEKNPDDENRLFYVGATRTKENLHIIEPKQYNKGFII